MLPRWLKPLLFLLCLLPIGTLTGRALFGDLGANPIEAITRNLGLWGLRLLLITLAVTPLRRLTGWGGIMRLRRMLGLFSFFYLSLHLLSYVVLDQFFAWDEIWRDIVKRPYITIGIGGFLLLLPLAITSTNGWIKRLGGRRWQLLHRLVYPAAIAAVIHYALLVKADLLDPSIYAVLLTLLFAVRLGRFRPLRHTPHAAH